MASLNPEQHDAVHHLDSPLLVLAGAGSGKTGVITRKVAHLLAKPLRSHTEVMAVTFTNKAAREMRDRIHGLLRVRPARPPWISTFHSLGLRFLQQDGRAAGLKPGFSIFDSGDGRGLLRELTRQEMEIGETDLQRLQQRVSSLKSELISPAAALSSAEDEEALRTARLYGDYERHLRAYNAVDFDDLIVLPVRLLGEDPDLRERWQNRVAHLLVDEYQDTNAAQYRMLRYLVGPMARFTVVGDDDQSIYAWRGAQPENLQRLQEDFPHLRVIKLEQNYRSTGYILKAANTLIAQNAHLFEKRLWSKLGQGERLRVVACEDGDDEVRRVVSDLMQHRMTHRARYADYAILYRSNHQARPFERALREHQVPYRITGGSSFFDAAEVRDLLAYLRLLQNPDDDAAFLRIVNVPRREIGASTLEKLAGYAQRRQISLLMAAGEMGLRQCVPERAAEHLYTFAEWMLRMQRTAHEEDAPTCLKRLLEGIDYMNWLAESDKNRRAVEKRQKNVRELVDWFTRLQARWADEATLERLLAHISLVGMLDRQEEADADEVQLLTLHSAKGLEFDHVYLVGVEEDLLPHRNSLDAGTLEEERRLAYVGITRARRRLTLTYAARRRVGGEDVDREPSRFLSELPAEVLEWERSSADADPAARQERGRAHLESLRKMLAGEG
jgi:ATP-dependent DNA helicase Rep